MIKKFTKAAVVSSAKGEVLENQRAEYGKEIVHALSAQLTREFGRGFGRRNLFNMIRFADIFSDPQIVHALSALSKADDDTEVVRKSRATEAKEFKQKGRGA